MNPVQPKIKSLLITGMFRSGTSLLASCVHAHPQVAVSWQPYWMFFKACRNKFYREVRHVPFDEAYPLGILQFSTSEERQLFADIFETVSFSPEEVTHLVSDIQGYLSRPDEHMNKGLKPADLAGYLDGMPGGKAGDILAELFDRLHRFFQDQGIEKETIGVKETFCEEFMEPLLAHWGPDGGILHIIRDPRSIIASRNYGKYADSTGSCYPIYFIIHSWLRSVQFYEWNKHQPNYAMIRYEDLVTQPRKALTAGCRALRIPFSEAMTQSNDFTDGQGKPWASNSSFERVETETGIFSSSVEKWKNILTADEMAITEFYCKEGLTRLGYPLTLETVPPDTVRNFREDTKRHPAWLRKYEFHTMENFKNAY
ncbi:MAG: sulfotransferase [Candidatus Omnitrophota bacterium]